MTTEEWTDQVVLPGEPASKARPRLGKGGNVYTPRETTHAEELWKLTLQQAGVAGPNDASAYAVRLRFHSGVWTRKDVDNMVKLVLDACNGVVWADDRQVVGIDAWLYRGDDAPRTELAFRQVDQLLAPTIECATCGRTVPARVNRQRDGSDKVTRFCSVSCSHEAKRVARTCPKCNDTFVVAQSATQRFCSRDCAGTAGGVPSSVTADQLRRAVDMMAAGVPQVQVAKALGVDRNALSKAIVRAARRR